MEKFSHNGLVLTVIQDTRRPNKEKSYPIKYRVTYQRKQVYYPSSIYLSETDWIALENTKKHALLEIRDLIRSGYDNLEANIKLLTVTDYFTFDKLNRLLGKVSTDTVNSAFTVKVNNLNKDGKVSTAELYNSALRSIKLFAGDKIMFSDITKEWLEGFAKLMYSNGKATTTLSMYCRSIASILNEAKRNGLYKAEMYPFGKDKFEIPEPAERKLALTLADIKKIYEYKTVNKTAEKCRDLWFFSYLCNGANIADMAKLTYENIKNSEICFYRVKTLSRSKKPKLIQATLTIAMKEIMEKHGVLSPTEYIFPILRKGMNPFEEKSAVKSITKLMNVKMKAICKEIKIEKATTYTARHSYATVLKRSGVSISFISDQLGHTNVRTTENYLASFEEDERIKNSAFLTAFD